MDLEWCLAFILNVCQMLDERTVLEIGYYCLGISSFDCKKNYLTKQAACMAETSESFLKYYNKMQETCTQIILQKYKEFHHLILSKYRNDHSGIIFLSKFTAEKYFIFHVYRPTKCHLTSSKCLDPVYK